MESKVMHYVGERWIRLERENVDREKDRQIEGEKGEKNMKRERKRTRERYIQRESEIKGIWFQIELNIYIKMVLNMKNMYRFFKQII